MKHMCASPVDFHSVLLIFIVANSIRQVPGQTRVKQVLKIPCVAKFRSLSATHPFPS